MNNNVLHMIVLTDDDAVRQIVESLGGDPSWRIQIIDETSALFSALNFNTQMVILDESATGTGYLPHIKKVRVVSTVEYYLSD